MENSTVTRFELFNVLSRGQTYLNIIYLLLTFPLGLAYFIFLMVGLSLGVGLLIIWIGIPILLLTLVVWWGLILFERRMAISFLGADIPELTAISTHGASLWTRFKEHISRPITWKGLFYLMAKFPLGVISFVLVVTFTAITAGLIAMPFLYQSDGYYMDWDWGFYEVHSFGEAFLLAIGGFILGLVFLHLMNWMAEGWKQFTRLMLSE